MGRGAEEEWGCHGDHGVTVSERIRKVTSQGQNVHGALDATKG